MSELMESQKKEMCLGLNSFNAPAEFKDEAAWIRQITYILFTYPGQYPNIPNLGIGLQNYQYEFVDRAKTNLESRIDEQIKAYLPDVPLTSTNIDTIKDSAGNDILLISFTFTKGYNSTSTAVLATSKNGDSTQVAFAI